MPINNVKPALDLDVQPKRLTYITRNIYKLKSIVNEEIKPHMLSIIDKKMTKPKQST